MRSIAIVVKNCRKNLYIIQNMKAWIPAFAGMTESGNSPRPAVPEPRLGRCVAADRQSINRISTRGRDIQLNNHRIPVWRDETSPSDVNFVHHSWEGYALSDVFLGGQPGDGSFDTETDLKNLP